MRYLIGLVLTLSLTGCDIFSAGTLGSFQIWSFPVPMRDIDIKLLLLYRSGLIENVPDKWVDKDSWKERGYGSLNGKIIYFKDSPEEMYYFTYHELEAESFGNENEFPLTKISVRAVINDIGTWKTVEKFEKNKSEEIRINRRFYKEVIYKLEKQLGKEAGKENF